MLQKLLLGLTTDGQEIHMQTAYSAKVIANQFIKKSVNDNVPINKTILIWLVAAADMEHKEKFGRALISEKPERINDEIIIPTLSYHYNQIPRSHVIDRFIYTAQSPKNKIKKIAYFPPSSSFEINYAIDSAWTNLLQHV